MRIDDLFGFTVIPHCIVAVFPMLKEDSPGRNVRVKSAFLNARMFEKYLRFLREGMINRNLVFNRNIPMSPHKQILICRFDNIKIHSPISTY